MNFHSIAPRLKSGTLSLAECAILLTSEASEHLEEMAEAAVFITRQRFGRTIKLFAPLYISNECVNDCTYCGFKRDNPIVRVSLDLDQVMAEAEALLRLGHHHLLLVSGEHPRAVTPNMIAAIAMKLKPRVAKLAIEVQPYDETTYRHFERSGIDGVTIFQETYDRDIYSSIHRSGPKKNFDKRLAAIDAAGKAGMRFLGLGALLGLTDWPQEALSLITHARWLKRRHWKAVVSISFPRLTAAVHDFVPPMPLSDRDLVQMILATRLALPDADLVLSTREPPLLRDRLMHLGITTMSAGSKTEPGGYVNPGHAGEQFHLEDTRSPRIVAESIVAAGLDPVWKDWDARFHGQPQ